MRLLCLLVVGSIGACGSYAGAPIAESSIDASAPLDGDAGADTADPADARSRDDGAMGHCPPNALICEDFEQGDPGWSNRVTSEGGGSTVATGAPWQGLRYFEATAGRGDGGPPRYGGLVAAIGGMSPKRLRSRFAVRFGQFGDVAAWFAIADPRKSYRVVLRATPRGARVTVEMLGGTINTNGFMTDEAHPPVLVSTVDRGRWHTIDWSAYEDGHADVSMNDLPPVQYAAPQTAYDARTSVTSYIGCFGPVSLPGVWLFDFDNWSLVNE
jgi:hypothetical protein